MVAPKSSKKADEVPPEPAPMPQPVPPNNGEKALSVYGDMAGMGLAGLGTEHFAVPFLAVLQSGSPQCKKADPKYIPGAEEGMFINTVSGEIFPGRPGVFVVPCAVQHVYTAWKPRNDGGGDGNGFRGVFDPKSKEVLGAKKSPTQPVLLLEVGKETLELVETFQMYAMIVDGPNATSDRAFVVISFTSTKIKAYKGLMYTLHAIGGRPPIFANLVRLRTLPQKNSKGSFFNVEMVPSEDGKRFADLVLPPTHPLVKIGFEYAKTIVSGAAVADYGSQAGHATSDDEENPF